MSKYYHGSGYSTKHRKQKKKFKFKSNFQEATLKKVPQITLSEYDKYLQSAHWQQLRKIKLEEAEYRCQICYRSGILHVHHRTYSRIGFEKLSDLTVLCEGCHNTFHSKMQVLKENSSLK